MGATEREGGLIIYDALDKSARHEDRCGALTRERDEARAALRDARRELARLPPDVDAIVRDPACWPAIRALGVARRLAALPEADLVLEDDERGF